MSGAPQFTLNGYAFGEVASALQKEIRRANEEDALFWCLELATVGHYYVWRRLATIAAEDIGLANPLAVVVVHALWESYVRIAKEGQKGSKPDDNFYAMAIIYLCRSPKSRIVDEFKNAVLNDIAEGLRREIPAYAKDVHTGARGATQADWWKLETEGVTPYVEIDDLGHDYLARARREVKPVTRKIPARGQTRLFEERERDAQE